VIKKFAKFIWKLIPETGWFKEGLDVNIQQTANCFTQHNSAIWVSALNASKVYDKVNHAKLFIKLCNVMCPSGNCPRGVCPRGTLIQGEMGARRHRQGGTFPSGNVVKCSFAANVVSKVSVDEVFIYYFEKMSSASGSFAFRPPPGFCPWNLLGDFVLQTPLLSTPGKNPAGVHGVLYYPLQVFLFNKPQKIKKNYLKLAFSNTET